MQPLISIVLATYNGEKFIRQQIESILEQDYDNLEIIIIDDCSTDTTVSIVQEYAKRDNRIDFVPLKTNLGAVGAFEAGLSRAKGKYIALSDQDDIFDKNKISTMSAELSIHPDFDMVVSDLRLIAEDGAVISESMWRFQKVKQRVGKPFHRLIYTNFVTGCSCMFTNRLLKMALPFPRGCIIHDWWLSVLAASARGGGILLLPSPLVSYRQHGVNVIGAHSGGVSTALRRAPDLNQRTEWYSKNVTRIEGYLESGAWNETELKILQSVKKVFYGYVTERDHTLLQRLLLLPSRLAFALAENPVHLTGIVVFTLVPRIVEFLRDILPTSRIGSERKGG